jgi:prepilin-type N-terminal cleavage/methylation domain-containing protein
VNQALFNQQGGDMPPVPGQCAYCPIERGFTLVEIAIVLVIIGVMLTGILNAQSIIRNARIKDTTRAVMDMTAGARQFRDRYGAWPGDLSTAGASIPGLTCANGNGNGQVGTAAESTCASEMLIRSAMLRGDVSRPITIGGTVTLSVTSPVLSTVTGLPANWINVIRIQNIDCDIAIQLDRALDDGNVTTGYFRTNTVCAGEDENIPVPNAVLQLS